MTTQVRSQWEAKPGWTFQLDGGLTNVCGMPQCDNVASVAWHGTNMRVCDRCVPGVERNPESVDWNMADDGCALFLNEPRWEDCGNLVCPVTAFGRRDPIVTLSAVEGLGWQVRPNTGWPSMVGLDELSGSVYAEPTDALVALQERYAGYLKSLRRYHALQRILGRDGCGPGSMRRFQVPPPEQRSTSLVEHQLRMASLCSGAREQSLALDELFAMSSYCRLPMWSFNGLLQSADRWRSTGDYLTQWMRRCYMPYPHDDGCALGCADSPRRRCIPNEGQCPGRYGDLRAGCEC